MYYKFERGLGKKDIQIAPMRCTRCTTSKGTFYSVMVDGKKAYICGGCKE